MKTHLPLTIALLLAALTLRAQDEGERSDGPAAGLTAAPFVIPKDATTWRDYNRQYLDWAHRRILEPLKKNAAGQPWGGEAVAFATDALVAWTARPESGDPVLTARGRKLLDAGCDDPLINYLWAFLRYRDTDNWSGGSDEWAAAFKRSGGSDEWAAAFKSLDKAGYPKALARIVGIELALVEKRGRYKADRHDKQIAELTRGALAEGSYDGPDAMFFVAHTPSARRRLLR